MESVCDRVLGDVAVLVERCNRLERENEELRGSMFHAGKFYAVASTVESVSKMHDVSPYLVREYVRLGLIPTHPRSTQAKILIRMSDALLLDFRELREKAKERRLK